MSPEKLPPEPRNEDPPFRSVRDDIEGGATIVPAAIVMLLLLDYDRLREKSANQTGELRNAQLLLDAAKNPEKPETADGYDTEVLANAVNQILSTSPEAQARIIRALVGFFDEGKPPGFPS